MSHTGYYLGRADALAKCSENQVSNRYWTIVYVKQGSGIYSVESSLRSLNGGDIYIIPPGVKYSFSSSDLGDEYNINIDAVFLRFDQKWLDGLVETFPVIRRTVLGVMQIKSHLAVQGPKWMKLTSVFNELCSCPEEEQPLKVLAILTHVSTDEGMVVIKDFAAPDAVTVSSRKEKIDKYLGSNFLGKVTLQEVADYVGVSRTYFSMFFKAHYNEGFADYLNRRRISHAARLLKKTSLPVSAISAECGFRTVQYFTRAFRKVMGVTPAAYRGR